MHAFVCSFVHSFMHSFVCLFVSCCAVLCCAVLCCAVLCCAVLCCAVLCCAVLCCVLLCAAASPLVGQSGQKCPHDGNGISSVKGKKQKRREVNTTSGSNSGGKGKGSGQPFCPGGERLWLVDNKQAELFVNQPSFFTMRAKRFARSLALATKSWSQRSC